MQAEQQIDISRIFHLEKELLNHLKREQKEELSSLKRPENKAIEMFKNFFSLFRKLGNEDSTKRGKEEIIEELLTYFEKLKESGDKYLAIKYLNLLDENRLKKLYGIELNKYNLKSEIEVYPIVSVVEYYPLTEENLTGAFKLISDIIVALERLKGNEPNKNKIN